MNPSGRSSLIRRLVALCGDRRSGGIVRWRHRLVVVSGDHGRCVNEQHGRRHDCGICRQLYREWQHGGGVG